MLCKDVQPRPRRVSKVMRPKDANNGECGLDDSFDRCLGHRIQRKCREATWMPTPIDQISLPGNDVAVDCDFSFNAEPATTTCDAYS